MRSSPPRPGPDIAASIRGAIDVARLPTDAHASAIGVDQAAVPPAPTLASVPPTMSPGSRVC
ncbi:hypothetical protein ACIBRY_37140 [Streptomyces anulatus]